MTNDQNHPANGSLIPLSIPEIRGNEWQYIKDCLDTGWVSSAGAYVDRFEKDLAEYVGADHGVATVNGTAALHVALQLAGVRAGDEVIVSTLTFIAPVNAIRYVGAWPHFIDAEPDFWQMAPEGVTRFLEGECEQRDGEVYNKETGRRVAAILPVHILGHPVDLDPIAAIAQTYGLPVIEDASESLGALYKGRRTGQFGDIACFSFNGNKLITTGGGGLIATDNAEWAARAKYLTTQAKDDPVEYIHGEVGYNYRLTNLQAAMGCAQLEALDDYIAAKRRIAAFYQEGLANLPGLTLMPEADWAQSTFWMYTILIDEHVFGMDSRALLNALAETRIQTRPLWQPIHQSPAHRVQTQQSLPVAEGLYRDALSLPCSVGITDDQTERVCQRIRMCCRADAGG